MSYQIKGDLQVLRTIVADRRTDSGLRNLVITATEVLDRHCAWWQNLSAAAPQIVTLPDATGLPNGWQVVIAADGASDLDVQYDGGTSLRTVTGGLAYTKAVAFTLMDNATTDGVWQAYTLEDFGYTPAWRYTDTFDATTDWGAAVLGYYTMTYAAATHLKGVNPVAQIFETIGGVDFRTQPDQTGTNASGDIDLIVPDAPDCRFAGRIIIL